MQCAVTYNMHLPINAYTTRGLVSIQARPYVQDSVRVEGVSLSRLSPLGAVGGGGWELASGPHKGRPPLSAENLPFFGRLCCDGQVLSSVGRDTLSH